MSLNNHLKLILKEKFKYLLIEQDIIIFGSYMPAIQVYVF